MNSYEFAITLVCKAGERLNNARLQGFEISHKGSDVRDVVTNLDVEISNFLIEEIKSVFPEHSIYSEEDITQQRRSEYEWVIDPIDGSANFSRNIPHFSVCVALLHKEIPVVGAVYNPITKELFSFEDGRGAFLNDKPIAVSTITTPSEAQGILVVGHQPPLWNWGAATYRSFLESLKKIKAFGSSALDLSFLAAGRADIVVYGTLTTKDCAAGIGIVRAAGGEVYTPQATPVEITSQRQTIIATGNRKLFEEIRGYIHPDLLP